jgi:hypothetical protein
MIVLEMLWHFAPIENFLLTRVVAVYQAIEAFSKFGTEPSQMTVESFRPFTVESF